MFTVTEQPAAIAECRFFAYPKQSVFRRGFTHVDLVIDASARRLATGLIQAPRTPYGTRRSQEGMLEASTTLTGNDYPWGQDETSDLV